MFTGLIADLGTVQELAHTADGARLAVASALAPELAEGDSIAVNGVCLTATSVGGIAAGSTLPGTVPSLGEDPPGPSTVEQAGGRFEAEAMNETLARTSLGALAAGDRVNLELALRAGDRLGGHFVQGHVDGTGAVTALRDDGFSRVVTVQAPPELAPYLVEKGSVALDGVSLTVSSLDGDTFSVSLIPETVERTNFSAIGEGSVVNIEVDMLAKHVERLLAVRA